MAKMTWLCCERRGDIFEGTDGTQYCKSCRNILYSNRKHALITCEICGKQFIGGAKAKFCTDCNKEKYRAKQRVYARERRAKEREQEKRPIVRVFVCEVMHPHSFRHYFAMEFIKRKNDIALLADLLGHGSVNVTQIYLRQSKEQQKKVVDDVVNW